MSALTHAVRWVRSRALEYSGLNRYARARLDGSCAAILTYHRVLPLAAAQELSIEPAMFVTPETFRRQVEWLQQDLRIMPLHEVVARLRAGEPLPLGACCLTFDDGWRDNHDHALPVLEDLGAPATVFLVADRVGTCGAFWPDEAYRRLRAAAPSEQQRIALQLGVIGRRADPISAVLDVLKSLREDARESALELLRRNTPAPATGGRELLNWEEVARMQQAGIDFESHGATHAILTSVEPDRVMSELRESLERLRARGYARERLLAYPSGVHDALVRQLARAAGYGAAVTTRTGLAAQRSDLLSLPRLSLHEDVSSSRIDFRRVVPGLGPRG